MSEISTGEIHPVDTQELHAEGENFTPFTEREMKKIFDELQQSQSEINKNVSDNKSQNEIASHTTDPDDFLKAAELMATIHQETGITNNETLLPIPNKVEHTSGLQKVLQSISRFFKKLFKG